MSRVPAREVVPPSWAEAGHAFSPRGLESRVSFLLSSLSFWIERDANQSDILIDGRCCGAGYGHVGGVTPNVGVFGNADYSIAFNRPGHSLAVV